METKSEKRERINKNQGKMIVRRGVKLIARIKQNKADARHRAKNKKPYDE